MTGEHLIENSTHAGILFRIVATSLSVFLQDRTILGNAYCNLFAPSQRTNRPQVAAP